MSSLLANKTEFKPSKIPVLKKIKVLKPLRNNDIINCCEDQFKYCRNYNVLKHNIHTMEQNFGTSLKENNFLRQQLSIANQSSTIPHSSVSQENKNETSFKNHPTEKHVIITDPIGPNVIAQQPFLLIPGHPFDEINVNTLDQEITYSHDLNKIGQSNIYGDVPYKYGNIIHQPCSIPETCYLIDIINQVNNCSHILLLIVFLSINM